MGSGHMAHGAWGVALWSKGLPTENKNDVQLHVSYMIHHRHWKLIYTIMLRVSVFTQDRNYIKF